METKKFKVYFQTTRVNSRVTGEIEIQVEESDTQKDIELMTSTALRNWVDEQIEFGVLEEIV